MTSPQTDDGYTRIANELFDAILDYKFTARQLTVLMAVIRKTYGYNKKVDDMSAQQISDITGIARPHIVVAINDLVKKSVLVKQTGKFGQVLGVNKNYKEWYVDTKTVSQKTPKKRGNSDTETVSVSDTKTVSGDTKSVPPTDTESVPEVIPNRYQEWYQNGISTDTESVPEVIPNRYTQKTTPKDNSKRQLQKTVAGEVSPPPRPGRNSKPKSEAKTTATWEAYSSAYRERYGIDPVRNAKVSGQLAQFVTRVPQDEAPFIAEFFVRHNGSFYAAKLHPVGLLLNDAEKLRTEWATNRQMTATRARQIDEKQSNFDLVAEALRLDAKEGRS